MRPGELYVYDSYASFDRVRYDLGISVFMEDRITSPRVGKIMPEDVMMVLETMWKKTGKNRVQWMRVLYHGGIAFIGVRDSFKFRQLA